MARSYSIPLHARVGRVCYVSDEIKNVTQNKVRLEGIKFGALHFDQYYYYQFNMNQSVCMKNFAFAEISVGPCSLRFHIGVSRKVLQN